MTRCDLAISDRSRDVVELVGRANRALRHNDRAEATKFYGAAHRRFRDAIDSAFRCAESAAPLDARKALRNLTFAASRFEDLERRIER